MVTKYENQAFDEAQERGERAMSEELPGCPFCGCLTSSIIEDEDSRYARYCIDCLCSTPFCVTIENANELWSTRTPASLLKRMAEALLIVHDALKKESRDENIDDYLVELTWNTLTEYKERG